ncbi:acetyl-CoA hydrolase/transferase family protein [Sporomusa carbonis]|uniref:acetyl-CoA hydrolase/transferase family protein n=1 Tax=Sporomusa carbonis TaxID=3076075 RepID=UPI003C7BB5CB
MNWRLKYQDRIVSAQAAVRHVCSNDRIALGMAAGEPAHLVNALMERSTELQNVEIVHMLAIGSAPYVQKGMEKAFRYNGNFLSASTRAAVAEGRADFTPCFFHEVPRLFKDGYLPVDVAMIQVSPPDENGECSFGVSVDYIESAARTARLVIAQINTHMPRTGGTTISLADIDWIVEYDQPLPEIKPPVIGPVERAIGEHVATLVPDGATLQLGIGAIPDAVLLFLKDKKDLGIHSEMFSDGVVELVNAGVITNRKKSLHPNKFIATFLIGTKKLYDFVDNNPAVEMYPVDYVNDPYIIGRNNSMISINSALQVDLMGQVNAEMVGSKQFSGIGGQVDFVRGAGRSAGGKSIIAIPSTAAKGQVSRIVSCFESGTVVSTLRNDVHYVVTEYGIANLRGKSLKERAKALIAIAHPDFRSKLEQEAKSLRLL